MAGRRHRLGTQAVLRDRLNVADFVPMPEMLQTFRLMLSSPSDVTLEHSIARQVIHEWNSAHSLGRRAMVVPVAWGTDTVPSMQAPPQEVINQQLVSGADILVAIFWTRIGSPTSNAVSGTVEEIDEHLSRKRPALIYFSDAPVRADSVDPVQYGQLRELKDTLKKRGLVQQYESPETFRVHFGRHLAALMNSDPWILQHAPTSQIGTPSIRTAPADPKSRLSREAIELLREATQDANGVILHAKYIGGASIQTNGKQFVPDLNYRARAIWEAALGELVDEGYIAPRGSKGEIFHVTRKGFEFVEARA